MTPRDAFAIGAAAAVVFCFYVIKITDAIARRARARADERNKEAQVRDAFVRLSEKMALAERVTKMKWDMPGVDRIRQAQIETIVQLGIRVSAPAAS